MQDEDRIPIGFPSWREIAGVVAGLVPFGAHYGSTSSAFRNGKLVAFHHRDWIAIVGGGVAVGCALLVLTALARTEAAKRAVRIAAAVALVALGGYQVARGFGRFTSAPTPPGVRAAMRAPRPPVPADPVPAIVPISDAAVGAAVETFFARWRSGDTAAIHADVHPDLRGNITARRVGRTLALIAGVSGPCDGHAEGMVASDAEDANVVLATGTVSCAKAPLTYRLRFRGDHGVPRLTSFNLDAPDRALPSLPNTGAADVVKAAMAALVAHDLPKLRDTLTPSVDDEITDATAGQFFALIDQLGKVKQAVITKQEACKDSGQCLEIRITGARAKLVGSMEVNVVLSAWLISFIHLDDPS